MRCKITALGIKTQEAIKIICDECGVSKAAVYTWITGRNRPRKQYLFGISNALHMRHSRLLDMWMKSAIAKKHKAKSAPVVRNDKPVEKTFIPNRDDLQVAVDLVKMGHERKENILNLVMVLELGRTIS